MVVGEGRSGAGAGGFGGAEAAVGVERLPARACPAPELPTDDLVTPAPRWVLVAGAAGVVALLVSSFLLFWRGMGTALRQSAVEAFGVVFGALVVVSVIGAFRRAALAGRGTGPDGTDP